MSLSIQSRSVGDITVLTCSGRIVEGDESGVLESSVNELLPLQPYIVLDLGGVTFLDSAGLGMLLRLHSMARTAGGDLKICAANHRVREVLRMTKLQGVLPPHESDTAAITAFYTAAGTEADRASLEVDVLCVHPSQDVLAYARGVLKQADYGVTTATNVSDARVLLRATTPSALVIDADSQAGLEALSGEDLAAQCAVIHWPAAFSTEDPGDAARQLLDDVNRVFPDAP